MSCQAWAHNGHRIEAPSALKHPVWKMARGLKHSMDSAAASGNVKFFPNQHPHASLPLSFTFGSSFYCASLDVEKTRSRIPCFRAVGARTLKNEGHKFGPHGHGTNRLPMLVDENWSGPLGPHGRGPTDCHFWLPGFGLALPPSHYHPIMLAECAHPHSC